MIVLSDTKTFGSNFVNEAHVGYIRLNNNLGIPKGGVGVSLADQGISSGPQGIQQGFPQVCRGRDAVLQLLCGRHESLLCRAA